MKRSFWLLLAISFFLLSLDRVFVLDPVRDLASYVLSPVSYGLYQIAWSSKQVTDFTVSLPRVYQDNLSLKDELLALQGEVVEIVKLREENQALRSQLMVQSEREKILAVASVVGVQQVGNSMLMIIDRGQVDGIGEGRAVVQGEFLIGRVERVIYRHAYVLPIFGVDSRVPVKIYTQGVKAGKEPHGLVVGQFNQEVQLTEVLQEVELNRGDVLVSSGEGGVYPAGLILGSVEKISSDDSDLFQTAKIEPSWQLDQVQTVFVY